MARTLIKLLLELIMLCLKYIVPISLLISFYPFDVYPQRQVIREDLIYLEREINQDLEEMNLDSIRDLKRISQKNKTYLKAPKNRPRAQTFKKRHLFYALVPKKTVLFDLNKQPLVTTKRELYVLAQDEKTVGDWSFVLNQKKQKKYMVQQANLKSLSNDLFLHPQVDVSKNYREIVAPIHLDEGLLLQHYMDVSYQFSHASYFSELHTESESSAQGVRYQYKNFIQWDFPLLLGPAISFDSGNWATNNSYSSTYVGAYLKHHLLQKRDHFYSALLGIKKSLFFTLKDQNGSYKYSSNLFEFSLEREQETAIGTMTAGFFLSRSKNSLKSSTKTLVIIQDKRTIDSFGLYIGYTFKHFL
jgi:hypothetical protein